MSMMLKTRKLNGIVMMEMCGRLEAGEPILLLREAIRKFVQDGNNRFLFNLGNVSFIDSRGLGELISAYTTVRRERGDVKLLHLTKRANGLLQMVKLLTVFETFSDEAQAIKSFENQVVQTG